MGTKATTRSPLSAPQFDKDGNFINDGDWRKNGPMWDQYASEQDAWKQTTGANRPDTQGAFGNNQEWTTNPDGTTTLKSGFDGAMGDAASSIQEQYAEMLRTPMQDGQQARDQAIDASYRQATSRLDPQWERRRSMQNTQLLNQGLDPTSEAGRNAAQDLSLAENDAYSSAMNSAIQSGTAAGDSVFRNSLAARNNPLQQMQSMQGLLETPRFNMAGASPYLQWLQSIQMHNNAKLGETSHNNQLVSDGVQGAATAAAAAAAMMSDERTKQNVQRLDSEAIPGVPWATWEYKDAPGRKHFGVIAQDLEKVSPEHVLEREDGVKFVDLNFLTQVKADE